MLETAGTKLRRRRILRQLELRDAARQTRINADRLADLEADEYSNFPNLAYAKSFLRSYARFLDVDLRTYIDAFEDTSTFGLDDYQYLSEKPVGVYRVQRRSQQQRAPKVRRSSLVMTASFAGICVLLLLGWFFFVTYQRLGGDLNQLADRQEAREHGNLRSGTMPSASAGGQAQPAGVTPAPTAAVSPVPQGTPASGDNIGRDLVATTLAQSSPSAVLSQLSAPAANLPVPPTAAILNPPPGTLALQPMLQKIPSLENPVAPAAVGAPAGTPGQDDKRFIVHRLDNDSVDVFRTGVPHAQPPARNTLE